MVKVHQGVANQQIKNLQNQDVKQRPAVAKQQAVAETQSTQGATKLAQDQIEKAPLGMAQAAGKEFDAPAMGQAVGQNALNLQIQGKSQESLDQVLDSISSDAMYTAKSLMNDDEHERFLMGTMSGTEFRDIIADANSPQDKTTLQQEARHFDFVYDNMDNAQRAQVDAGQMSLAQFQSVNDMICERLDAQSELDPDADKLGGESFTPINLSQPEQTKQYKSTDIVNRLFSGESHNVMFGGQLMDRAVLQVMFQAIKGQGDGRVSKADSDTVLGKILDAGKVTQSEENALLFGFKHCRWTGAADKHFAAEIAKKFPDSPLAIYGGLASAPKFKDYQQYDLSDQHDRQADLYGAKMVMNPAEFEKFAEGEMSLQDFNNVLQRASTPMRKTDLAALAPSTYKEAVRDMSADEKQRLNSGKMCPSELQNIQYRAWEKESSSMVGMTPYQESYTPGFKPFVIGSQRLSPKGQVSKLNGTLKALSREVKKGNWDAVLQMFPKDIVDAQISLGMGKPQFLAEAFGISTTLPKLQTPDNQVNWELPPFGDLNQISAIKFDTAGIEPFGPEAFALPATVALQNGQTLVGEVLLDKDHQLSSAVG